jgi:hypothetical protein
MLECEQSGTVTLGISADSPVKGGRAAQGVVPLAPARNSRPLSAQVAQSSVVCAFQNRSLFRAVTGYGCASALAKTRQLNYESGENR